MDDPQSLTEAITRAIRSLLFRKAETINERLLTRLRDAAGHLSRNEDRAVIGALAGMEADVERMRTLMVLIRDHFQTENSKETL